MTDLIHRLRSAETDFLTALGNGTHLLAPCSQTWSSLLDDLSTALLTGNICNETLSLAHSVASRVSDIASCYLDIKLGVENISSQLRGDCDAMFHRMNTLNLGTDAEPKSSYQDGCSSKAQHSTAFATPTVESASTPFAASACAWLLDNLHNPYPTAEVKAQFAAASSCQLSSVNSWFINARRRIGWTTLCREHFSSCRADMLDAAYRALVEEDPQRILSPAIRHSLVAMKATAEGLYSSTFSRSAVTGELDAMVKDMAGRHHECVGGEKNRQVKQASLAKTARHSYPSPDRSAQASPVPALDASPIDEGGVDAAPSIVVGSKRRYLSMEPANQPTAAARRPIKRLRMSLTSQSYLPSPPSSTDGVESLSDDGSPRLSSSHSVQRGTNEVPPSSMQRLSDIDATGLPKHVVAPDHLIVSDPLPYPNTENAFSIDDWVNTDIDSLFTVPPPVEAAAPDISAPWDVELFNDYSIPGDALGCMPAPTDTQISAPIDFFELDNLLQPIANDAFATLSGSLFPSDLVGPPCTASLDTSMLDMSHIDWTSIVNGPDTDQSSSTFCQYPVDTQSLPETDPSVSQLPPVIPATQSLDAFASKQVKLDQLHAMQEAVRRMEQELKSEGVLM